MGTIVLLVFKGTENLWVMPWQHQRKPHINVLTWVATWERQCNGRSCTSDEVFITEMVKYFVVQSLCFVKL